jgi:hypothetical protein
MHSPMRAHAFSAQIPLVSSWADGTGDSLSQSLGNRGEPLANNLATNSLWLVCDWYHSKNTDVTEWHSQRCTGQPALQHGAGARDAGTRPARAKS